MCVCVCVCSGNCIKRLNDGHKNEIKVIVNGLIRRTKYIFIKLLFRFSIVC